MFKKKKKEEGIHVEIISAGAAVFSGRIIDMELREKVVIEKSIEFYNDPEPCYIHRGAVKARLYEEIRAFCAYNLDNGREFILYSDIPGHIKRYIDCDDEFDIIITI